MSSSARLRTPLAAALVMLTAAAGAQTATTIQMDQTQVASPVLTTTPGPQASVAPPPATPAATAIAPPNPVNPDALPLVETPTAIVGESSPLPGSQTASVDPLTGEVDPFARPVEEEITQEVIEQTDLSEQGTSIIGQIFQNEQQIRRLLGEDVSFIYRTGNRRDPMIIPWIRREFDRQALLTAAQAFEQAGDIASALDAFRNLRDHYAGSREAGEAAVAIERLEALIAPGGQMVATAEGLMAPVSLPLEVSHGLSGIIGTPGTYECLIGNEIYGQGDKIPNFEVTVLEIQESAVVFLYQDQQFTVPMAN